MNVAYAALMEALTEETRAEWYAEVEPGVSAPRAERKREVGGNRNVAALLAIAGRMPRTN